MPRAQVDTTSPDPASPAAHTAGKAAKHRKTPITRQSQSCDACRARKVKCDRPPPTHGESAIARCSHCAAIDVPCVFTRVPKRRGPPNRYAMQIHGQHESATASPAAASAPLGPPTSTSWVSPESPVYRNSHVATTIGSFHKSPADPPTSSTSHSAPSHWPVDRERRLFSPGAARIRDESFPNYPHNPNNVLDNVLPRGLLFKIVDLHFEYVYPLTPLVHRRTFWRDINMRREELPGQEDWVALVLAIIATTICQLPEPLVPVPREEARGLVLQCFYHVRGCQTKSMENVSLTHATTTVFLGITAHLLGQSNTSAAVNGMLNSTLSDHRWHLDHNLPPLQREMWRRIFWHRFCGDRTVAVLYNRMSQIHEDDAAFVELPTEIDDEYLTEEEYLEQPPGHVPVITGYNYCIKVFKLLGEVLELRRRDRRKIPQGTDLRLRLIELDKLQEQLLHLMDGCPAALQLDPQKPEQTIVNLLTDLGKAGFGGFDVPFLVDSLQSAGVKDAFLVQQANIYVTRELARIVLVQHREELLRLEARDEGGTPQTVDLSSVEAEKEHVVSDLLTMLERIPLNIIAVNTRWLVGKVRFIACCLLDPLVDPSQVTDQSLPDRAQRYLWSLLRMLGDLEGLYSPAGLGRPSTPPAP